MTVEEWLGKENKIGIDIWNRKYRYENESFDDWLDRVSGGNESVKNLIKEKKFLFGGRILANRGLDKKGVKMTLSNCFIAGTKVITKRGLLNIEDVKVGDEVVTDDGSWQKVNEVMCRDYQGDMYRIKSSAIYDDIVCTPNHQFLTQYGWKRADRLECPPMRGGHYDKLKIPDIQFKKDYGDIDLLNYVHLEDNQKYEEFDGKVQIITSYYAACKYGISDTIIESRKQNTFKRLLKLDSEMMYFIGRWLGDGSVTLKKEKHSKGAKGSVLQIVFNATTEKDAAEKIIKIGTEHFGFAPNVRTTNQNVIAVRWNSETICNFFAEEFGRSCTGKKIPEKYIGDINIACGLIDADGFIGSHGATKIVLKNESMIDWLKDTLYLNGMNTSKKVDISTRQPDSFRIDIGTGVGKGKLGHLLMKTYHDKRVGLDNLSELYRDYISVKAVSIDEDVNCKVYNLSVENRHSYTANGVVVHNCYVIQPPSDDLESIFDAAKKLARTFSYGGGCGVDISKLAPKGAKVSNTAKQSTGSVSFMDLYSLVSELIGQNGRRAALMISISCEHPDVENFIEIKSDLNKVTKANISIRITDEFMRAVKCNGNFKLSFTRKETGETIEKTVKARDLFDKICQINWNYAEPGMLFWDRIESWNLLSECKNFHYGGVNPCFDGDMELLTVDGYKTFKELCGTEPYIFGIHGDIEKGKVWCSGEKDTVKIKVGNNEIICTPEHKFMTIDGKECMAKDLKGKYLMSLLKKLTSYSNPQECYVKDVEPYGKRKVYDFLEPKSHWGVVEGYIVHNCGEEPLPAGGSCLLGSLNLSAFVTEDKAFDCEAFIDAVTIAVGALNEALDEGLPLHPLKEQRESVRCWRQIGLGIFGLADMLIKMGIKYGSTESLELCYEIAYMLAYQAIKCSADLAEKNGMYPMCDIESVISSEYFKNILKYHHDKDLLDRVQKNGLNNSQLLTIAPTGTLSTMLGISGGIEPVFANYYTRKTESLHGHDEYYKIYTPIVQKYMDENDLKDDSELPDYFVTAQNLNYKDRIDMQSVWQKYIDASISSTINVPNSFTVEDVKDMYMYAWKKDLKGVTMYRAGCAREGVLVTDETKEKRENPTEEKMSYNHVVPISRKTIGTTNGNTYCKKSACGTLYITINKDSDGNVVESFVNTSKGGICQSNINAVNRMISLNLRSGVKVEEVADQLKGITCPACVKVIGRGDKKLDGISCPDIIAKTLLEFYDSIKNNKADNCDIANDIAKKTDLKDKNNTSVISKCPDCGAEIYFDGGCVICPECGWSRCE